MARSTWLLATTSLLSAALAVYFYLDNRSLRDQLADAPAAAPAPVHDVKVVHESDPWAQAKQAALPTRAGSGPAPALPDAKSESRLERRQRRTQEFAAMFGRMDGETEDEYRARIVPLIKAGLAIPRERADEMRKEMEEKAKITPEQSKKLDRVFDKTYADVLDYTNKAITDGTLSPYERNVSGWLQYAGGLGGILEDAQGGIGHVLSPDQLKTISDSGFEWGEYLGVNAPWEQLTPPPPPGK